MPVSIKPDSHPVGSEGTVIITLLNTWSLSVIAAKSLLGALGLRGDGKLGAIVDGPLVAPRISDR